MAAAGASAAAAAAAARRRQHQEEEEMTNYSREDLENEMEFKIVRANTETFKKPEVFRKLIDEEARAGWQLVEKFDNQRVRFKRPISARKGDAMLPPEVDPYRARYGMSENAQAGIVLLAVFGVMVVFVVVAIFLSG